MKKLQLILILALVTIISSCSKDDATPTPIPSPAPPNSVATNFAEIKLSHIQTKSSLMTTATIQAKDATGILWPAGTVLIFKTTAGIYGKFEVVSINQAKNEGLTLNVVLFNTDGTIKSTTSNFLIRRTFGCDLDIPVESDWGLQSDFKWEGTSPTVTSLVPLNGVIFLKYTF